MKNLIFSIIAAVVFSASGTVSAGNPFLFSLGSDPQTVVWENSSITWFATDDDLSPIISNEQAVAAISELFGVWQNAKLETADGFEIDAVDLDVEFGGVIDLDGEDPYNLSKKLGGPVIIFDNDGSRIEKEFGEGSRKYVVGYAAPIVNGTENFVGGIIVMNGLFVDGDRDDVMEIEFEEFKAAMLHEIGHLLNLDHTQANIEAIAEIRAGDASLIDDIPTMYPILYSSAQLTLSTDDVIAIAKNYPSRDFSQYFCTVIGDLVDEEGAGIQGVNVVGRASSEDVWGDVRTHVSGAFFRAGTEDGSYVLSGIIPNKSYDIYYQGIDSSFTGGSSFAPLDPPLAGVVPGVVVSEKVLCSAGGEVVAISAVVEANEVVKIEAETDDEPLVDKNAAAPAAGCSLIR